MNAKRLAVFITSIILVTAIVGGTHFTFSFNHGLDTFHRTFLGWLPDSQFLNFKEAKIRLPERPEEVSVIAVGDIMPSRGVANRMRAHNDFNYPFLSTRDYLKTADIVFGNLESPITPGRKIQSK
ncbi:MAG TPA: CapA family protein, partial [Anaerolineae bacterium]|nr:CapA family protein [Anaerolineae bacterium]